MANDTYPVKPGLWGWINRRLPVDAFLKSQVTE